MLQRCLLLTALLFSSTFAVADEYDAPGLHWYTAPKVSIGAPQFDASSHHGTLGDGRRIGAFIEGALDDPNEDYAAGIGLAMGFTPGPESAWRYEAELIWRYRTDWDLVALTPSVGSVTNVFTDVQTTTLLFNVLRTGRLSERWRWEVGAGVGAVHNHLDSELIERGLPGVRPSQRLTSDQREAEFAWNAFLGASRKIGQRTRINLRYRYVDFGDLEVNSFGARGVRVTADYASHELQLTIERSPSR